MTSLGRDRAEVLDDLLDKVDMPLGWGGAVSAALLAGVIEEGLATPEPEGEPDYIDDKASDYTKAARGVETAHGDIRAVATAGLPGTWVGHAGSKASEVTGSAAYTADEMSQRFRSAGRELRLLATGIREAKAEHGAGVQALHSASHQLGEPSVVTSPDDIEKARGTAQSGLRQLRAAVVRAEDAGETAARELRKMTSEARAGRLDSRHLSAADRVVMAGAAAYGGARDENEILTATDLQRSGAYLDRMGAADRSQVDTMLDDAKSPQERAYVMKAVATGHNVAEVRRFRDQIHAYGDNPRWLQQHLTPMVNRPGDSRRSGNQSATVRFGPRAWEQKGNTCVAMSTVTAHAQTDPTYALTLTTGGHPGDPAQDNPDAFEHRMRDEERRVYDIREDTGEDEGMTDDESEVIADSEIGSHTGSDYADRELDDSDDREDALPDIRRSVDSGKPVPVSVRGDDEGHQMMIIGEDGGRLQLYNPWGFTTWVDEDDFVRGDIAGAADSRVPEPTSVRVPD